MVIANATARLTLSSLGDAVLVVATSCDLPAGQASRVLEQARQIAERHMSNKGG